MMNGYGWCLLRATAPDPTIGYGDVLLKERDDADARLWAEFRSWMAAHPSPWLRWSFAEQSNNDRGVLTFSVSRNHRSSVVWDMLEWIRANGPGSYGLLFVHDDEDGLWPGSLHGRSGEADHTNVFRVHRLLRGEIVELADPFFGPISPHVEPW